MKSKITFLAAVGGVWTLMAATLPYNYWQAANGTLDGKWGDVAHWSEGHLPTDGETATIDPLRFGGGSADFTIEVDADYKADALLIGDPDNSTRNQRVTFTGTGSLDFKGTIQHIFRSCQKGITFDGPDFTLHGTGGLLNYSCITVKNGSRFYVDASCIFWKMNDSMVVDDGGEVSLGSVNYNNTGDRTITVNEGGSFACRSQYRPSDAAAAELPHKFGLVVNGGVASVQDLRLTRPAAYVKMTAGKLKLVGKPTLTDFAQLDITGGLLTFDFDITESDDDPFFKYLIEHPTLVDGCHVFNIKGGKTFRHDGTFYVSKFQNLDKNLPLQIDCDRLVFDGKNWPFQWANGGGRIIHLYGPTEIRVNGKDFDNAFNNCYLYCHGKVVVDTRDWSDPSVTRKMYIRGFHSADGTLDLTVKGGGTFKYGQSYAYETCASFKVEEGIELILGDRNAPSVGSATEWGPLTTEQLTLEKGVKVSLTAGEQQICASRWSIDPTVKFTVTITNELTHGAFPILMDLDSKELPDALLSQIALAGNCEGWQLINEHGQISAYRRDPAQVGLFGTYEWIGGSDTNWKNPANWGDGQTGMTENKDHVFGGTANTTVYFNGAITDGNGSTLGGITFQTNAVTSFNITGNQATFSHAGSITSYSWVPQYLAIGLRSTGSHRYVRSYYPGPIICGAGRAWEVKSGNAGTFWYSGDVRMGTTGINTTQIKPEDNNTRFPAFRSAYTVISGGNISFVAQTTAFDKEYSTLRVSKGGTLQFAAHDGAFYQWSAHPASIVVDGTLNIAVPYRGGRNQTYRGSGRLNVSGGTESVVASSVTSFADTLQVYPTTWNTVTAGNEDKALAMGANGGNPVIHVADGWTYGPAAGVEPTCTAEARAFLLENGAVATIDAAGGTVRFADGVRGVGTLAIADGTLQLDCACDAAEAVLAVGKGSALKLKAEQNLGSIAAEAGASVEIGGNVTLGSRLSVAGAAVSLAPEATVTAAKGADLEGTRLDLGGAFVGKWHPLVVAADGRIEGQPTVGGLYRTRVVTTANGAEFQCKSQSGLVIFVE